MTTRIPARFAKCAAEGRPALRHLHHGRAIPTSTPARRSSMPCRAPAPTSSSSACRSPTRWPDGPGVQAAGQRALAAGQTLRKTLAMVEAFRKKDNETPIVLMGYYNPIYIFGVDAFLVAAKAAGVDGLIVVDLPPEEDDELCLPALKRRPQLHPPHHADHRRQAPAGRAQEHLGLRLLCDDDRHHRRRHQVARRRGRGRAAASRAIPICRSPSASASRPPTMPPSMGRDADGVVVGTAHLQHGSGLARQRQGHARHGLRRHHAGRRPCRWREGARVAA